MQGEQEENEIEMVGKGCDRVAAEYVYHKDRQMMTIIKEEEGGTTSAAESDQSSPEQADEDFLA